MVAPAVSSRQNTCLGTGGLPALAILVFMPDNVTLHWLGIFTYKPVTCSFPPTADCKPIPSLPRSGDATVSYKDYTISHPASSSADGGAAHALVIPQTSTDAQHGVTA